MFAKLEILWVNEIVGPWIVLNGSSNDKQPPPATIYYISHLWK